MLNVSMIIEPGCVTQCWAANSFLRLKLSQATWPGKSTMPMAMVHGFLIIVYFYSLYTESLLGRFLAKCNPFLLPSVTYQHDNCGRQMPLKWMMMMMTDDVENRKT